MAIQSLVANNALSPKSIKICAFFMGKSLSAEGHTREEDNLIDPEGVCVG